MTRHLPTEARRAQILDAARSAMLAEGYQGARMSAIASAAGLSKGAIYFHFDSKQALAEALVDREFGRAHALVERALAQPEAPSIGALALTFAQVFLSEPGGPAERFVLLTGEIAVLDAVIGARIRALHTALVGGLAELLYEPQGLLDGIRVRKCLLEGHARLAELLVRHGRLDGLDQWKNWHLTSG